MRSILFEYLSHYPASELTAEDQTKWLSSRVNVFFEVAALLFIPLSQTSPESNLNSASSLNVRAEKGLTFGSHSLASICATECCSSAVLGGGDGESASSRQSLHSRTDNSTAGANASARVCLCVCVEDRETPAGSTPSLFASLFPPWLHFSSPFSGSSPPFLLYTFFSLICSALPGSLVLCLLLPRCPLPPSLLFLLFLAEHHLWRWMSPRLKLRRLCP